MHCSSNALGWAPSGTSGQCEGRRYLAQDDHGAYLYMHGSGRAMALTQFDRVGQHEVSRHLGRDGHGVLLDDARGRVVGLQSKPHKDAC